MDQDHLDFEFIKVFHQLIIHGSMCPVHVYCRNSYNYKVILVSTSLLKDLVNASLKYIFLVCSYIFENLKACLNSQLIVLSDNDVISFCTWGRGGVDL